MDSIISFCKLLSDDESRLLYATTSKDGDLILGVSKNTSGGCNNSYDSISTKFAKCGLFDRAILVSMNCDSDGIRVICN